MAETNAQAQTPVANAQPTEKPTEKSKVEIRREAEKALRQAKKPDYRSAGVTIKVLKANPKKVGSNAHAVFARYAEGMTVADLLALAEKGEIKAANGTVVGKSYVGACLMWDDRHGFIELLAPAKPVAAEQVKEAAQAVTEAPAPTPAA